WAGRNWRGLGEDDTVTIEMTADSLTQEMETELKGSLGTVYRWSQNRQVCIVKKHANSSRSSVEKPQTIDPFPPSPFAGVPMAQGREPQPLCTMSAPSSLCIHLGATAIREEAAGVLTTSPE
ncbi:hypothetical protein H1C71_000124, partial [Ictidomys tridecemlineatus]